ncbi:MAG: sigma 54-interacting transcriptional regulator [Thermoanaerobacteraceae bacterium]|nr:sigma 54-interacting transcriptional regulator [Thermoanaerobacteraceae bacterium]
MIEVNWRRSESQDKLWHKAVLSESADIISDKDEIKRGWQRCFGRGVDYNDGRCRVFLSDDEIEERLKANYDLFKFAKPFMESLFEVVKGSGYVVALADKDLYVLDIVGDECVINESSNRLNFVKGACWSEEVVGNTAISTAILEGTPIQIENYEHFCRIFHSWVCSAAPIYSPDGRVLGAISMSGFKKGGNTHTLGMVIAAAKAIENQLAMNKAYRELELQHKYQDALVSSMTDGMVMIDAEGKLLYMNEMGGKILGVDPEASIGKDIKDVVDYHPVVLDVLETGEGYVDREFLVKTRHGRFIHFIKTASPIKDSDGKVIGVVDTFREIKRVTKMVNRMSGATARFTFDDIKGCSPQIRESLRLANIASQSMSNVLITGESGTGKEMFAQAIHNASILKDGPFVAINCVAIPRELIESELFGYEEGTFTGAAKGGRPGKFELANGGTIFLDEIGDMPLDMQGKLLRVLQEKKVARLGGQSTIDIECRIIAATNKDLLKEVEDGNFRRDLYYRLNVLTINLSPLRERKDDIPLLIGEMIKKLNPRVGKHIIGISKESMEMLMTYDWPGNVRELENAIERAANICTGEVIELEDLPRVVADNGATGKIKLKKLDELEEEAIKEAIKEFGGNITQAAKFLGISRNTLYSKMDKYGIKC